MHHCGLSIQLRVQVFPVYASTWLELGSHKGLDCNISVDCSGERAGGTLPLPPLRLNTPPSRLHTRGRRRPHCVNTLVQNQQRGSHITHAALKLGQLVLEWGDGRGERLCGRIHAFTALQQGCGYCRGAGNAE